MKIFLFPVLVWFAAMAATTSVRAEESLIAVASNFAPVAKALKRDFEASTGHRLRLSMGSTGKLYAQIKRGAPFDAFLAADAARPELLLKEGDGVKGSMFTYAVGRLALWSAEPKRVGNDGKATLVAGSFRHLAIANPSLAPYGAAARQVLEKLGLSEKLKAKLVTGENIGQTFSMVATGNAELGLVALASLTIPNRPVGGSRWEVPADLHDPIRQNAVLLRAGAEDAAARAFLAFIKSKTAILVIRGYGYGVE